MDAELAGLTAHLVTPGPVPAGDVEAVGKALGIAWPGDYLGFMVEAGGGEGWVGPGYLSLWPVGDLVQNNLAVDLPTFAPNLVGIGTDGGGELFAFESSASPPSIVMVPLVGLDQPIEIGSFSDLLRRLDADQLFELR